MVALLKHLTQETAEEEHSTIESSSIAATMYFHVVTSKHTITAWIDLLLVNHSHI